LPITLGACGVWGFATQNPFKFHYPKPEVCFFDKFKEKINKRKLGLAQGGELRELVPPHMTSCTMLWALSPVKSGKRS